MYRIILILSIILFTAPLFADEATDKAEFKKLYAEFNDLYANSEAIDPIIEVGEKLYELTPKAYGKNHMNTAVVTYNLANLLTEKLYEGHYPDLGEKAVNLYEEYFDILEVNDVEKGQNYINQYQFYLKALAASAEIRTISSKVNILRRIAKKNTYTDAALAPLEYNLGLLLFRNVDYAEALKYFKRANQLFIEEYGADNLQVGETYFWMAKIQMARTKNNLAKNQFLKALDVFDKNGQKGTKLSQSTHAFLVQVYEEMSMSDKATLHCQAIAEERPKDFDLFIEPLYRKNPEYPQSAIRSGQEANVLLEFDVDTNGFTRNIKIIESDNDRFNKNSIEAAENYRYAPSVKDGKIIKTTGARVKIAYRLVK